MTKHEVHAVLKCGQVVSFFLTIDDGSSLQKSWDEFRNAGFEEKFIHAGVGKGSFWLRGSEVAFMRLVGED